MCVERERKIDRQKEYENESIGMNLVLIQGSILALWYMGLYVFLTSFSGLLKLDFISVRIYFPI